MEIFLILLSVLPVILLGRYIYNRDFEKEPKGLLAGLFFMGLGAVALTLLLTFLLTAIFPFFGTDDISHLDLFSLLFFVFIGIALIEEFSKWFFVYLGSYHHYEFNHAYDAIVYATFVSLGFACLENFIYVFSGGLQTAIIRAITAVPGHVCYGVIMGFYLGMAKTAEKHGRKELAKKHKLKSLFYPVLAHGLYDYLIFSTTIYPIFLVLFIVYVVVLFNETPKWIRRLARIHYDIGDYPRPKQVPQYHYEYCPVCGFKVMGKYCQHCGHKHIND